MTAHSYTRRRFLSSTFTVATALELRRAAFALGLSTQAGVCKLTPEQEVGPYYVKDEMLRSDISEGKSGVPLSLKIVVLDARTCDPIARAAIDLWHCDSLGVYSGYTKQGSMGPGGPPPGGFPHGGPPPGGPPPGFDPEDHRPDPGPPPEGLEPRPPRTTDAETFLRGIQMTDKEGSVCFHTVFPGCYMGRTNHVHFKVRMGGAASGKTYHAGHTAHTGQVFFPEEAAATLMQRAPYARHRIDRTTQAEDPVFGNQHGELSIAALRPTKSRPDGFEAELVASVDPFAVPPPAGRPGPRFF